MQTLLKVSAKRKDRRTTKPHELKMWTGAVPSTIWTVHGKIKEGEITFAMSQ